MAAKHKPFSFAVFGDPQIGLAGANKDMERFRLAVEYINGQVDDEIPVSVAVICGDLTQSQEDYQVAKFRQVESKLKAKVFRLPGNHDIWNFATHAKFLKDYQQSSTWYSETVEGCEFVILDTVVLNAGAADLQVLKLQEWAWFEQVLARCRSEGRRHIFVFGHHPVGQLTVSPFSIHL